MLSKTTFGGLRNWVWSGRCLFLSREMTESRQKGGRREKTCRRWGAPKTFLGMGFTVIPYVPPPPGVFHPQALPLSDLSLKWTPTFCELWFPNGGALGGRSLLGIPNLSNCKPKGPGEQGAAEYCPKILLSRRPTWRSALSIGDSALEIGQVPSRNFWMISGGPFLSRLLCFYC